MKWVSPTALVGYDEPGAHALRTYADKHGEGCEYALIKKEYKN